MSASNSNEIEIDELNCSICQESFGEGDHNPRILDCGHTFCSSCLRNLLQSSDPLCPDCRTEIYVDCVEVFPVCYIVKQIADTVKSFNQLQVNNEISLSHKSEEVCYDDPFPYVGKCSEHMAPKHFWCKGCKLWVCGTCAIIQHQNPQTPCRAVLAKDAGASLMDTETKKVYEQRNIFIKADTFLYRLIVLIKEKLDKARLHREIPLQLESVTSMSKKLCTFRAGILDALDIIDDSLEEIATLDISDTQKKLKTVATCVNNLWECQQYPKTMEDILEGFWQHTIWKNNMVSWILEMAELCIFTADVDGTKHQSGASKNDKYFLVPSLKKCDILHSNNVVMFHISDLYVSGMYTYMELSENGQYIGSVIFHLYDRDRSLHFKMMFTGEKGPSYKGTRFFQQGGTYNCFLAGGDYEYNNGAGGKCIYLSDDNYNATMCEGLVCGSYAISMFSQFKIFYEVTGQYKSVAREVMASVVDGLDLIREIAVGARFLDVVVSECGLLFYYDKF